uniref:Uncharacterized protein n=1 Tax=Parascaris equorum TaxID=6256 RepID=A0A914RJ99_PAREQ
MLQDPDLNLQSVVRKENVVHKSALEQIIKDECIDIRLPLDWTGKVLEKDERDSRRRAKEKEAIERKKGGTRESKDV